MFLISLQSELPFSRYKELTVQRLHFRPALFKCQQHNHVPVFRTQIQMETIATVTRTRRSGGATQIDHGSLVYNKCSLERGIASTMATLKMLLHRRSFVTACLCKLATGWHSFVFTNDSCIPRFTPRSFDPPPYKPL